MAASKRNGRKRHTALPRRAKGRDCDPLDLQLDPQNPRLHADERGGSQDSILAVMINRFKIEELAQSILSTGYKQFDPLVGVEEEGAIVILEGNRRLAALKLLIQPDLAPLSQRKKWTELSEALTDLVRGTLSPAHVEVYPDRTDPEVTAYIGFRHVTGPLKWPALEKAYFISLLIERDGLSYKSVAERLGTYPVYAEQHYVAFRIVQQARERELPGVSEMEQSFGVLLRALQTAGVVKYLGVTFPARPKSSRQPVPQGHMTQLASFIAWTFGTEDEKPVLADSRDLTRWGRILTSPDALRYLAGTPTPSFERAWIRSGGQAESLVGSLLAAADRLEEATPLVSSHVDDSSVTEAVDQCMRFMVQILSYFPGVATKYKVGRKHDSTAGQA